MELTVKEIIKKYLDENGYDGLYCPDLCACKSDDLAPCDNLTLECEPGFIRHCDSCNEKKETSDGECPEGWDYCLGPKLKEKNEKESV